MWELENAAAAVIAGFSFSNFQIPTSSNQYITL
jgi:hypothetical protein